MNFFDLFILAGACAFSGLVAYVLGHSTGWHKGFNECSEAHAPKGNGGEK